MQQIGRYRVLGELARGGMGVVHRAQAPDGQLVALKVLLKQRAKDAVALKRFSAEVGAWRRLNHPGVVRLLDAGDQDGVPWLALDYVEGETLAARIERGPLPVDEALRIARQLVQALGHVHGNGLLHRDLKPDNVLLRDSDALLTDFGLVLDENAEGARITRTGVFLGTPGYWPPEQIEGTRIALDARADVYGFGGVLYACLTGRPPLDGKSLVECLETIRFKRIRPPQDLRPECPAWLSELCMRCLAFDPSDRPESMSLIGRALAAEGTLDIASARRRTWAWLGLAVGLAAAGVGGVCWAVARRTPAAPSADPEASEPTVEAPRTAEANALNNRGAALANAGRPAEAIELYDQALRANPTSVPALANRGMAHTELGRFTQAIDDYDQALRLDPNHVLSLTNRGVCKVKLERYAEALADYDRALELSPDDSVVLRNRGVVLWRLDRRAESQEDLTRALELDPNVASTWKNRGINFLHLGHCREAIADFDRSLRLDGNDPEAWANRGSAMAKLGDFEAALVDYTAALRLDPDHYLTLGNAGIAKAELGQYPEALADLSRALQFDPADPNLLMTRGEVLIRLERYADAFNDFNAAVRAKPREARVWSRRGVAQAMLKRYPEAIADFDQALSLDPRLVAAWTNRGLAKLKLGQHREAIADFDEALRLDPGSSHTRGLRELSLKKLRGGGD